MTPTRGVQRVGSCAWVPARGYPRVLTDAWVSTRASGKQVTRATRFGQQNKKTTPIYIYIYEYINNAQQTQTKRK